MNFKKRFRECAWDKAMGRTHNTKSGQYYPAPYDWQWVRVAQNDIVPPIAVIHTQKRKEALIWLNDKREIWLTDYSEFACCTDPILSDGDLRYIQKTKCVEDAYLKVLKELSECFDLLIKKDDGHILSFGMSSPNWNDHNPIGREFISRCIAYCLNVLYDDEASEGHQHRNHHTHPKKKGTKREERPKEQSEFDDLDNIFID